MSELPNQSEVKDESSDDEELFSSDTDEADYETVRPKTESLGLHKWYVSNWGTDAAFREFYQNWKDGLVQSFNLDPRSFAPQWEETAKGSIIQITLHRPSDNGMTERTNELLGYIRFKEKAGSVELTNFNARLEMRHLTLGATSKAGQAKFAGKHGEGFKVAALVMCRNNHCVKITTSSHYWNFKFRGTYEDRFACQISAPRLEPLLRKKEKAAKEAIPRVKLSSRSWKDVSVEIFRRANKINSEKVTREEFLRWTEIILDLKRPADNQIIRTEHGDLILDKEFAGKIYLKGLFVSRASPRGRSYEFGYNFITGSINRDRERMADGKEEAEILAKIWREPIMSHNDDATQLYIDLFCENDEEVKADIAYAVEKVTAEVARILFGHLRRKNPNAFFYSDLDSGDENQKRIIVKNIDKEPYKLPLTLWKLFDKHKLVRTPQQEVIHAFRNAPLVEDDSSLFSRNVMRLVRATLLLTPKLATVNVRVVSGGTIGIDVLYKEENMLLIHDKWLSFERTHENDACELSSFSTEINQDEKFFCDHVVEELNFRIMEELQRVSILDHTEAVEIRKVSRERIRQMPRSIRITQTSNAQELHVCWAGNEGAMLVKALGENLLYLITLHRFSSCWRATEDLILFEGEGNTVLCKCPRQVVSRISCETRFRDLDPRYLYFPMVARKGERTFFGLPPPALSPKGKATRQGDLPMADQDYGRREDSVDVPMDLSDGESERERSLEAQLPLRNATGAVHIASVRQCVATLPGDGSSSTDICAAPSSSVMNGVTEYRQARSAAAWRRDDAEWHRWHEEELPDICSRLFRPIYNVAAVICRGILSHNPSADAEFESHRLGCIFQRDKYFRVREKFQGGLRQLIILVHSIHSHETCSRKVAHLVVTMYSFLHEDGFQADVFQDERGDESTPETANELLLYCRMYEFMGDSRDAGVISIEDITEVEALEEDFDINYCVSLPAVRENSHELPCRFAHCSNADKIALMPINPNLFDRKTRRRLTRRATPDPTSCFHVIDMTPNVLGPLVGFTTPFYIQGVRATALGSIGFDETKDFTWRANHSAILAVDGSPTAIIDDMAANKFETFRKFVDKTIIASIAAQNSFFSLTPANKEMPDKDKFLAPLFLTEKAAVMAANAPDFTVLQMPSAILHKKTRPSLSSTVWRLLQHGQTVHLEHVAFSEFQRPLIGSMLVLVTSPHDVMQKMPAMQKISATRPAQAADIKLKGYMGPGAYADTRIQRDTSRGLVIAIPGSITGCDRIPTMLNMFNHATGNSDLKGTDPKPIDLEADMVHVLLNSPNTLMHPDRQDILTVREIARLKGFDDFFIFYGSLEAQYREVLAAQPPILSASIFCRMWLVMKHVTKRRLNDRVEAAEGSTASKRTRTDTQS